MPTDLNVYLNGHILETKAQKIKLEDKKSSFVVFLNPQQQIHWMIKFDEIPPKHKRHEKACDWIIYNDTDGVLFVELKKRNPREAVQQIESSILSLKDKLSKNEKVVGVIVTSRSPHTTTTRQNETSKILLGKKVIIRYLKHQTEHHISKIFNKTY